MKSKIDFEKRPSEIELGIVFFGLFNPDIFSPKWMFDNRLISKNDLDNIQEIEQEQGNFRMFFTEFLKLRIEKDSNKKDFVRVWINDLKAIEILIDFVILFNPLIKSSAEEILEIDFKTHYQFDSKNERKRLMNKSLNTDKLNSIFDKPKLEVVRIDGNSRINGLNNDMQLAISPCNRPDLTNPLHVNIYNQLSKLVDNINIFDRLNEDLIVSIVNNSIDKINLYFK